MTSFSNRLEIGERCNEIFLTTDVIPQLALNQIHMAGISELAEPYLVERVQPAVHTLLFTSSGQGLLTDEIGSQLIQCNSLTVIPAHTNWRIEIVDDHWHMCWILLPTSLKWNALMPAHAQIQATAQASNILHLSHVIDQERQLEQRFLAASCAQLARYIELNLRHAEQTQSDRLSAAFAQVEQSLHKPWQVQDIAELTFYSEPHLYRLCKQRYGQSPKQMIRNLRIERAKQLLLHTDWPMAELAARLGYSDQFNFSNRFKKAVGVSPMQFRQQTDAQ